MKISPCLAAIAVWCALALAQEAGSPRALSVEEFERLHRFIKPQEGECRFWQVPWLVNVAEARILAGKQKKPMAVLSGHRGSPLGNCRWSVSAARDPAVWSEEFTHLIRERCVSVTVFDAGQVRKRQDAVGQFFVKANLGTTALTSNFCFDVVTAQGKHLGRIPFNTPGVALQSLRKALQAFDTLPDAEKEGAQSDAGKGETTLSLPIPPPGTLLLRVYYRQLGRRSDGTLRYTEPSDYTDKTPPRNRTLCREPFDDVMWVMPEEWKALVPEAATVGTKVVIPDRLKLRLFRYHLNPRVGFTEGPCFARATTQDGQLSVTVEKLDAGELHLRLEGVAKLRLGDDLRYEPALLGKLVYSQSKNAFTRFDLVALGDVSGHIQHGGGGFRPGAQPLGIAFELADPPRPTDYLPPCGAGDADYVRPK